MVDQDTALVVFAAVVAIIAGAITCRPGYHHRDRHRAGHPVQGGTPDAPPSRAPVVDLGVAGRTPPSTAPSTAQASRKRKVRHIIARRNGEYRSGAGPRCKPST